MNKLPDDKLVENKYYVSMPVEAWLDMTNWSEQKKKWTILSGVDFRIGHNHYKIKKFKEIIFGAGFAYLNKKTSMH